MEGAERPEAITEVVRRGGDGLFAVGEDGADEGDGVGGLQVDGHGV